MPNAAEDHTGAWKPLSTRELRGCPHMCRMELVRVGRPAGVVGSTTRRNGDAGFAIKACQGRGRRRGALPFSQERLASKTASSPQPSPPKEERERENSRIVEKALNLNRSGGGEGLNENDFG